MLRDSIRVVRKSLKKVIPQSDEAVDHLKTVKLRLDDIDQKLKILEHPEEFAQRLHAVEARLRDIEAKLLTAERQESLEQNLSKIQRWAKDLNLKTQESDAQIETVKKNIKMLRRMANINGATLTRISAASTDLDDKNRPSILNFHETSVYSQNGEDGLLARLFTLVGAENKFFVEIGAGGLQNNTNNLFFNFGWKGAWFDINKRAMSTLEKYLLRNFPHRTEDFNISTEKVTKENINELVQSNCPVEEPDLLTIDVDGVDAFLFDSLKAVRPRVIMVEYNPSFGLKPISVPYNPDFDRHDFHNFYHGASLSALTNIAHEKGYGLLCCDAEGVNALYLRQDLLVSPLRFLSAEEGYMPGTRRTTAHSAEEQWELVKEFPYVQFLPGRSTDGPVPLENGK